MTIRKFQFRLSARYESPENTVTSFLIEHQLKNEWQLYDSTNYNAGFLILLYAILNCQHMYFRVNTAEQGLQLKSAQGTLEVEANNEWEMQKLRIHMEGHLIGGTPGPEAEAYIIERMTHCPVSVNLKAVPDMRTTIAFKH